MSADDSSTPSTVSLGHLKHHPEFWFDDGSIVLVTQDTGFRVYRGLLASQSIVFADMLTASSSGIDEIIDGCPVIPLTDSPHDLAHLFRVLLPTSPVHYHVSTSNHIHSFEALSAVIRLADKYHIESVQDQALRALQRYHFTSDFDAFCGPPDAEISVEPIHAIGAVNLAHLMDIRRMLPLSLYKCCCLDDETLLAGWRHADGTIEHLTPADLERCSNARSRLLALHTEIHTGLVDGQLPHTECTFGLKCAWYSGLVFENLLLSVPEWTAGCDVLSGWGVLLRELASVRQPCRACVGEFAKMISAVRRRLWDALPEMFGVVVEGWKSPEDPQGAAGAPAAA